MVWWLFGANLLGVVATLVVGRASMPRALAFGALAPAATAVWAAQRLVTDAEPTVHELIWVSGLDVSVRFRADSLALLMTLLVSGIGALVFTYAIGYFSANNSTSSSFPASLLAFSTSMLGLVLSDSVWALFIFWELTSVTSFLLVGHKHVDESVRKAARRALIITGAGGLVLLAGLTILAREAGSAVLTGLEPITGSAATIAGVLIMIGAATKSAQVPFHVWLPGAMAAPTPVSAYLHSATMVKAGVLLVATVGPVFTEVGAWTIAGIGFGAASMLWGAVGALRQQDAKLILAWGTVSQLGLLVTLFSLGDSKATFAGVSILLAHAVFKAALFLAVGEIDVRTGTRDVASLGGLWRSMPSTFIAAALAALSMAGAPPLLGFMAKEAALEAALGLSGFERTITLTAIVAGSVLTVAYTVRFMFCVFGPGPQTQVTRSHRAMTFPMVALASLGLLGYVAVGTSTRMVVRASAELDLASGAYALVRWPGLKAAFVLSMGILVVGCGLGLALARVHMRLPRTLGAAGADGAIDGILAIAPRATARIQHGSLPVYLVTLAAAATIAAGPFFADLSTEHLRWWDEPMQGALALATLAAALAGAFIGSRLGAALTLGAVGIGISGLFVVHGAPDLALTQLLVETVIVVGFVIGLGQLRRRFPRASGSWRVTRIVVAVGCGAAVAAALVAASAHPAGQPPIEALVQGAVEEGGGNNVVNVILTDTRALDTLGEVVVLATVAVGIIALARNRTREAAA